MCWAATRGGAMPARWTASRTSATYSVGWSRSWGDRRRAGGTARTRGAKRWWRHRDPAPDAGDVRPRKVRDQDYDGVVAGKEPRDPGGILAGVLLADRRVEQEHGVALERDGFRVQRIDEQEGVVGDVHGVHGRRRDGAAVQRRERRTRTRPAVRGMAASGRATCSIVPIVRLTRVWPSSRMCAAAG